MYSQFMMHGQKNIKLNKAYWDVTMPIKCLLEYDSTN